MEQPTDRATESERLTAAVRADDEAAFTEVAHRYRPELRVHCYRMVGSLADSEDLVQETLLKAWRGRAGFEGRAAVRSWLYKIATNTCLDFLESRKQRRSGGAVTSAEAELGPLPHVPWLQPYPDRLLEQITTAPDTRLVSREALELGYLVALQCLPPRQRAVLICCDVLDWSAKETAELLSLTLPAVSSALRRARETLENEQLTGVRVRHRATSEQERSLLDAYVRATEELDISALSALLREDLRCSMPPVDFRATTSAAAMAGWIEGGYGSDEYRDFRCVLVRTNGLPAVAVYRRAPGTSDYRPLALDVLKLDGELVAEITTFGLAALVDELGLPKAL